jgi:MarR family transcriptional regulator, transcriptional regulator for hemolysin
VLLDRLFMRTTRRSSSGGVNRLQRRAGTGSRAPGRAAPRLSPVAAPAQQISRRFYEVVPEGATLDSLDDKKLRLIRRILFLGRRWRNQMDEALRAMGDNHARWVTLLWVDMMAGRANLGELAEQIAVELPTLVRLLNRLEREGLVERRALGSSNRDKTVVLTAKGKRALKRMSEVINRTRQKFLDEVDERRVAAALELLDDVLAKHANVVMWPGHAE